MSGARANPAIGRPLPGAEDAVIDPEKLWGYALNPEHPVGQHKARLFRNLLGINQSDWEELSEQILENLIVAPISDWRPATDTAPEKWSVRLWIEGPEPEGRSGWIVTAWVYRDEDPGRPHLVTLLPETDG